MAERKIQADELIIKFLQQTLTDAEHDALDKWITASDENQLLFEKLTDRKWMNGEFEKFYSYDDERGWSVIGPHLNPPPAGEDFKESNNRKVIPIWKRWMAAASIILMLGVGSYFMFFNKNIKQPEVAQTQKERFKNDVDPGKYKAKLQLANGETILLDSAKVGELARQGKTIVLNKDGQLVYSQQSAINSQQVMYNILSTAKGETYSTVLSDGSKVWVNSASSIKYPVAFMGNERRVEITGEAYFEIKHNEKMPFKVVVNGMEVHDLGTEFNINAYNDEDVITTTLVSGKASVVKGNKEQPFSPGQQLLSKNTSDELILIKDADVEQATGWKNGLFSFNKADIKTVMRQLSRWYDVEIIFEGKVPSVRFGGEMQRDLLLSKVLENLKKYGVHFVIDGKKIIVSQ